MSSFVICDWLSGSHSFKSPVPPIESGRTLKIDRDGVIEWEALDWEKIRCPSSDTSVRIRCNGKKLQFSGNIGRFQRANNVQGYTVIQCVEKFSKLFSDLGISVPMFGAVHAEGHAFESGTTLSRVDLAGNFHVSDYRAWVLHLMQRPINQRHPRIGRYGPMWGYESKRSNWWKAKVYDKTVEQQGKRSPSDGETLARFEVQLGSEFLKREKLQYVKSWSYEEGEDMSNVIYGRFLDQIMRESAHVEDWSSIPPRLRMYAVLWRDGQLPVMPKTTFYRVRSQLKAYGVDISVPCNVLSLTKHIRLVDVVQIRSVLAA